jgi:hypothetical protein
MSHASHDVFSRHGLKWCRGRRRVLRLVPDATYPNMWRVVYPDGELGDLKSLTWARHEGSLILAVVGGGPLYRKAGRFPLYDPEDLDSWASARLGSKRRSTSDPV